MAAGILYGALAVFLFLLHICFIMLFLGYTRSPGAFYERFLTRYTFSVIMFLAAGGINALVLFGTISFLHVRQRQDDTALAYGASQYLLWMVSAAFTALLLAAAASFYTYRDLPLLRVHGTPVVAGTVIIIITAYFSLALIPIVSVFAVRRNRTPRTVHTPSRDGFDRTVSAGILLVAGVFVLMHSLRGIAAYNLPVAFFGVFISGMPKCIYLLLCAGAAGAGCVLVYRRLFAGWFLVMCVIIVRSVALLITVYGRSKTLLDELMQSLDIRIPGMSAYDLAFPLPDNVVFLFGFMFFAVSMALLVRTISAFDSDGT